VYAPVAALGAIIGGIVTVRPRSAGLDARDYRGKVVGHPVGDA
jgi:hypothetical protein